MTRRHIRRRTAPGDIYVRFPQATGDVSSKREVLLPLRWGGGGGGGGGGGIIDTVQGQQRRRQTSSSMQRRGGWSIFLAQGHYYPVPNGDLVI